jgi:hypothetical protein
MEFIPLFKPLAAAELMAPEAGTGKISQFCQMGVAKMGFMTQ